MSYMWIVEGIAAGALAGAIMGAASEIGYRLRAFKSSLVIIDGSFALRQLGRDPRGASTYVLGIAIHLATSSVFGIAYAVIARLADFDPRMTAALVPYIAFLWLAMLFTALPAAGQGILGRRIGRFAWAEQLLLHVVYGIAFWWALGWM